MSTVREIVYNKIKCRSLRNRGKGLLNQVFFRELWRIYDPRRVVLYLYLSYKRDGNSVITFTLSVRVIICYGPSVRLRHPLRLFPNVSYKKSLCVEPIKPIVFSLLSRTNNKDNFFVCQLKCSYRLSGKID